MRRIAPALLLLLIGCEWWPITGPVQIVNVTTDVNTDPTLARDGGEVRDVRAEVEPSGSAFRVYWTGGVPPLEVVAIRTSDGQRFPFSASAPGAESFDPGPPGQGAGVYSVTVGGVAAPEPVELTS